MTAFTESDGWLKTDYTSFQSAEAIKRLKAKYCADSTFKPPALHLRCRLASERHPDCTHSRLAWAMPAAQADTVMRIFSPVPRTASAMVSLRTDWGTILPWPLLTSQAASDHPLLNRGCQIRRA
jgi:hypothetical protein